MSDINNILKDWVTKKLKENDQSNLIGVELEFPIIKNNQQELDKKVIINLFHYLIAHCNFVVVSRDVELNPINIRNEENKIEVSLEYSYGNLEISIGPFLTIVEIEKIFFFYLEPINAFLHKHDHRILYVGLNPYDQGANAPLLNTPFHHIMSNTIRNNSQSNDYGFVSAPGVMSSIQTHISISASQFIEDLNFHISLNGIRALLFANSAIWNNKINKDSYRCIRDIIWKSIGLQSNDYDPDRKFTGIDDYCNHLAHSKIYYVMRECDYVCFTPLTLKDYFESQHVPSKKYNKFPVIENSVIYPLESDIHYFKVFDLVRISRFGSLEIRGDCQQPTNSTFSPTAFSLGAQCAKHEINTLLENNKELIDNLRKIATAKGFSICETRVPLYKMICDICELVNVALVKRGYGEEKYLAPIFETLQDKKNPAEKSMQLLGNGNLSTNDIFQLRE